MTSPSDTEAVEVPRTDEERRALAIKRLKAKSDFKVHLVVYLAVNTFLVALWAFAGSGPRAPFWPVFPLVGWGIAVVINGFEVYRRNPLTEDRIQREMNDLTR